MREYAAYGMGHADSRAETWYECFGDGDYLAHSVIRPAFVHGLSERQALSIAAYPMAEVKD